MTHLEQIYKGKKVLVTGHTGFKGAWFIQILHQLGAIVKGISLAPLHDDDLYCQIDGDAYCYASVIGDISNKALVHGEMIRFQPDFVFHLAAQALVRPSYINPVETFEVNVMGTVHVLDALRDLQKPCVAIMITTDKVYENLELGVPFTEEDKLGGYDPYAASKAACEIAISSYRSAYFNTADYDQHKKSIAAVRAGNVIGGGDMSEDRIIPDIVRAIKRNQSVKIRNPKAVRPWQHVLEPLYVYLALGAAMQKDPITFAAAYNIGPSVEDTLPVLDVVKQFIACFGKGNYELVEANQQMHEAGLLTLNNQKIQAALQWQPKWTAQQAIQFTADWYADSRAAAEKCKEQILQYFQ